MDLPLELVINCCEYTCLGDLLSMRLVCRDAKAQADQCIKLRYQHDIQEYARNPLTVGFRQVTPVYYLWYKLMLTESKYATTIIVDIHKHTSVNVRCYPVSQLGLFTEFVKSKIVLAN